MLRSEKLDRHVKTYDYVQPCVFCVHCGSTMLDTNFKFQIKCYACGVEAYWPGNTFRIRRRPEYFDDVSRYLEDD